MKSLTEKILKHKVTVIVVCLLVGPAFLAQGKNHFTYEASSMSNGEDTERGKDVARINELYGKLNQFVLLVPLINVKHK